MPRYKLRTLLIVLALGPMVLAWGWREYCWWQAKQNLAKIVLRLKLDLDSIRYQPVETWPDLTLERTPIIQVDLGTQEEQQP